MFKPMLAPNNKVPLKLEDLSYPLMASIKLDGIRCEFIKAELLSRSLKQIVNIQLREKFQPLIAYAKGHDIILDGEIYNHEIPFSLISSCVTTIDHDDKKAVKSWEEKCIEHDVDMTREKAVANMKFHIFDSIQSGYLQQPFTERNDIIKNIETDFSDIMIKIEQVIVNSKEEVEAFYLKVLDMGYEGLILKNMNGRYKCGRGTIKEGLIYKVKPLETVDAKIIEVIQGTNAKEGSAKTINELGRSVTSKKKEDRVDNNMVADFRVNWEDTTVKVSCCKMKHPKRKEVWKNKEKYLGKMIEYCFIPVGMKDKPRSPRFIRFREDKDE